MSVSSRNCDFISQAENLMNIVIFRRNNLIAKFAELALHTAQIESHTSVYSTRYAFENLGACYAMDYFIAKIVLQHTPPGSMRACKKDTKRRPSKVNQFIHQSKSLSVCKSLICFYFRYDSTLFKLPIFIYNFDSVMVLLLLSRQPLRTIFIWLWFTDWIAYTVEK